MLNTLLLSQDSRLIGTLQSVCASVGFSPTVCSESAQAAAVLAKCKFYGVIIDSVDPEMATQVLSTVRTSSSSRSAVSIVVSVDSAGVPGGTFVLRKPVCIDLATRALRAAMGPMLTEFSRYFRHPVQLPVRIMKELGGEIQATSINVSHRGMAIQMAGGKAVIAAGDAIRIRLTLPGSNNCIEAKGKVAWTDGRRRAGIQCEGISPRDRQRLEESLAPNFPAPELLRVTSQSSRIT